VCGTHSTVVRAELGRETPSCRQCNSTVRQRAVVHALSIALFGKSLLLPEFPQRPDLVGLGLSDWLGYAEPLAAKLGYRNTYYHLEPRLDITRIPDRLRGTLDFLISSDVLEHVPPPVELAFRNSLELLKPGGVLVLTLPYKPEGELLEHFPGLHEYRVVDFNGRPILVNKLPGGGWQVFEDLAFHDGAGETLEMRVFTRASVVACLEQAGFVGIVECNDDYEPYGVVWHVRWSAPFLACRPCD
jgi:SAM-dependent methyltransferase